jgi:hypothetical protein
VAKELQFLHLHPAVPGAQDDPRLLPGHGDQRRPDGRARGYGPGKFGDYADAYLYELSLDGSGNTLYEGDMCYTLMRGPFEHPQLRKYRGAIMTNDGQGFVTADWFTNKRKLDSEWKRIEREIDAAAEEFGDE